MIDLYFWPTPNGHKVTMCLEETGLSHRLVPIDIDNGEQFGPEFLAISPNNRIPAIVDPDPPWRGSPASIFESGAILLYLAEKTGMFLPDDPALRMEALQWVFWQVGGLGPMAGQAHHFRHYAKEGIPYAIERYTREVGRLYGVLNSATFGSPIHRGRIFHSRYGVLPMDQPSRQARPRPRRFSGFGRLVREGDEAAGHGHSLP